MADMPTNTTPIVLRAILKAPEQSVSRAEPWLKVEMRVLARIPVAVRLGSANDA